MTELARIQRNFLDALFDAHPTQDARLEVYRRTAFANLHGALAAAYPVVLRLVGAAFFHEAAARYARAVGSTSGDLHEYGGTFAAFLASYPHAAPLEYLGDVARLEWAVHESHRAPEMPSLDAAALARIPPALQGRIRFRLHPAVRLVASPHPILAIWEANQAHRDGVPAAACGAVRVLVRRIDGVASPAEIDAGDWTLLSALDRGATLDEACAALGEAAIDLLASALGRFGRERLLCGFEAPSSA